MLFGSCGWNQSRNLEGTFFQGNFFPSNISDVNTFQAGLSLNWNIFDGGSTITRIKNAKIAYENQTILKEKAEVKTDIANAKTNYKVKLQIFKMQKTTLKPI